MNEHPRNPYLTVDIVIMLNHNKEVVLIERANEPKGTALPGGFVDYGEKTEGAAVREAREETGLNIDLIDILGVWSDPKRDPRQHNVSIVYVAKGYGQPVAGDDAKSVTVVPVNELEKQTYVFDHADIVKQFLKWHETYGEMWA